MVNLGTLFSSLPCGALRGKNSDVSLPFHHHWCQKITIDVIGIIIDNKIKIAIRIVPNLEVVEAVLIYIVKLFPDPVNYFRLKRMSLTRFLIAARHLWMKTWRATNLKQRQVTWWHSWPWRLYACCPPWQLGLSNLAIVFVIKMNREHMYRESQKSG